MLLMGLVTLLPEEGIKENREGGDCNGWLAAAPGASRWNGQNLL